jgi:MFS family permease
MIDRLGPIRSTIIDITVQAILWIYVSIYYNIQTMMVISILIGCGVGAGLTLHSAMVMKVYGSHNFSKVMGYSYLIKAPALFIAAPLAGYLFDTFGSYVSTLRGFGVAFIFVVMALLALDALEAKSPNPKA